MECNLQKVVWAAEVVVQHIVALEVEGMLRLGNQELELVERVVVPLGDHRTIVAAGAEGREDLLIVITGDRPCIGARNGVGEPVATLLDHHRQAVDVDYAFANFSVHSLAVEMA